MTAAQIVERIRAVGSDVRPGGRPACRSVTPTAWTGKHSRLFMPTAMASSPCSTSDVDAGRSLTPARPLASSFGYDSFFFFAYDG